MGPRSLNTVTTFSARRVGDLSCFADLFIYLLVCLFIVTIEPILCWLCHIWNATCMPEGVVGITFFLLMWINNNSLEREQRPSCGIICQALRIWTGGTFSQGWVLWEQFLQIGTLTATTVLVLAGCWPPWVVKDHLSTLKHRWVTPKELVTWKSTVCNWFMF